MIKGIIDSNDGVQPNSKEMEALKENFPWCFGNDGSFDLERFKDFLNTKVDITHEGYELKFLGKNYARLLASLETTTVIVPDNEHNSKNENKDSKNIYISGDNLDGLKHLLRSYSDQIDCIYIDPPYNTGFDGFSYNDNFNFTIDELESYLSIDEDHAKRILDLTKRGSASHSAWLMFMYPRLVLARDLLSSEGAIFISIGSDESSNLRLLCNDIFGEENCVAIISRMMKSGGNKGEYFSPNMEFVLVYAKSLPSLKVFREELSEKTKASYSHIETEGENKGERFTIKGLCQPGLGNRVNQRYWIQAPDGSYLIPRGVTFPDTIQEGCGIKPSDDDTCWKWTYKRYQEEKAKGNIFFQKSKSADALVDENNNTAEWNVFNKIWLKDRLESGRVPVDIITKWENRVSADELKELDIPFDFAKPTGLIRYLVSIMNLKKDAYVLDFFSGSGSTAHAVMKANVYDDKDYRFIMVQLEEILEEDSKERKAGFNTMDELGIERIIRARKQIIKDRPDTKKDLGFKHYILKDVEDKTIDKLERFDPSDNGFVITNGILEEFGEPTVLRTWIVHDGYGFTANAKEIDFAGYKAYYISKHLYLINPKLKNEAIAAIIDKYENDGSFNPENIVLFGYSFTWSELESLKTNLARLREEEKNLRINYDVRY